MASATKVHDLALADPNQIGLLPLVRYYLGWGRSVIYDFCIVRVTSTWYEVMLEELDEGSVVLDVGVGTASALVKHRALLQKKNIRVIGIDNDDGYVKAATFNVGYASIENQIRIYRQDVRLMNDLKGKIVLPHGSQVGFKSQEKEVKFDAIMFSGTFAVLPKRIDVLKMLVDDWGKPEKCKVYITQAYQRAISPLARLFKPLLKYLTTVDHGDLITEYEANKMFAKIRKKCKLKTAKHEVIENSIDNALEAAYFTVLEYDPNNQGDKQEENKKNSKKNRSKSPLKHDKKEKEDTEKANNRNRSKSPTKHKR